MKKFTKNERLAIASAFKIAKNIIKNHKRQYICYALDCMLEDKRISKSQCNNMKDIIDNRLGEFNYTCEDFIWKVTGLDMSYLIYNPVGMMEMRVYRQRWLDNLIVEFSK